jgi:hypothetical protein
MELLREKSREKFTTVATPAVLKGSSNLMQLREGVAVQKEPECLTDTALGILQMLGVKVPTDKIRCLAYELGRLKLEAANEGKQGERERCNEYALHCRNSFIKMSQDLPQDNSLTAEVIAEGILKGFRAP